MALIDRTINGRLTCAESLGHREFIITNLLPERLAIAWQKEQI